MSGDLWQMARNGTTLLPSEVKKLAADYDRLRRILGALREPSEETLQMMSMPLALSTAQWALVEAIRAALAAAERETA